VSFTVQLSSWPGVMTFTLYPVQFPGGPAANEWRELFKLCASQRIFIPVSDSLFVVTAAVAVSLNRSCHFMRPVASWLFILSFQQCEAVMLYRHV